eukprot:502792-Pleurochrysis_carterae.AAC.1
MDGCWECMSTCCATEPGKAVASCVGHKRTGDSFDFGEGRLIKGDVVEVNGGEALHLEQVDKVAAAASVNV